MSAVGKTSERLAIRSRLRCGWLFAGAWLLLPAGVSAQLADAGAELPDSSVETPDASAETLVETDGSVQLAAPLPAPTLPAEPVLVEEPEYDRSLSTIMVTARYRKEDAQRVPIAITTVNEDQLRQLSGARSLQQITGQLPSLNIQGFSGRNQTITIRGLGTNAGGTNDGLEQGVGLYIDGVYRARTGSVITDLIDVESIQLLRGPQGTLFGKNTVAGAVDIRTVEPGFERSVKAELAYGNYNYLRGYFSVTQPLSKELTFRFSYLRTARSGLFYNTVYDEHWDNLNNDALRLDVVYKPTDNFKNRFIADYSMQECNCGFQTVRRALPTTLADGRVVRGYADKAAGVGYQPIRIDPFARKIDLNSSQADKMPSWGLQNRADLRLANNLTLSSISSFRNWKWLPHYDGDQIGADVSPLGIVETYQRQVSQEFRLASPGDQVIDYTAGLYFFWQQANDYQYTTYGTQASGWLISPSTPAAVLNKLVAFSHVVPETASYAGYGQATWNVTDTFHLTGGLRLTYEHKTGSYKAYASGTPAPLDTLPVESQAAAAASRASTAPEGQYDASRNTKNISWTGIVSYDVTDDIHAFATYSRGYKSPGINLVARSVGVDVFVDPEKVDDFEIGIKSAFFDGRFEINPTVFYTIDKNYQANFVNSEVTPRVQYITNVGTLISRGVELDLRLFPAAGFAGTASLTYNDATYDSYKNAPAQYLRSYEGTQDLSGKQASGAPRLAMGSTVQYSRAITNTSSGAVEAFLGGNWSYRSSFRAAVNLDPFSNVPGYHLVGLNMGVRTASRLEVSFWVRNLLDKDYFNTSSVAAVYGVSQSTVGEPRMFGATIRGEIRASPDGVASATSGKCTMSVRAPSSVVRVSGASPDEQARASLPPARSSTPPASRHVRSRREHLYVALSWVAPLLLLGVWETLARAGLIRTIILPAPSTVLVTARTLIESGELQTNLLASLHRAVVGFGIGASVGLTLGILVGFSRLADALLDRTIQSLRAVPFLAIIPLVIVWFGIGESSKVFLIALGSMFPMYLNTVLGIRQVDPKLVEMARVMGMSGLQLVFYTILPGALPSLLNGVRLALTTSWLALVVAETVGASAGIGFLATNAREFLQTDVMVLVIILYALIGLASDQLARFLERRLLVWHPNYARPRS